MFSKFLKMSKQRLREVKLSTFQRVLLETRQQATNGVTYAKPHITKP